MKFKLWKRRHHERIDATEATQQAERQRQSVEAQWPEVLELASWARATRERNHLTELFFNLRGGGSQ